MTLAYVVRGFHLFREVKGTHKKRSLRSNPQRLFFYASGGIAIYRALTFRKQKSFGTFADKTEGECA